LMRAYSQDLRDRVVKAYCIVVGFVKTIFDSILRYKILC
jgi:hypothetical protein